MRSRRRFIMDSALAAAGTLLAPGFTGKTVAASSDPAQVGLEGFVALVGKRFRVRGSDGRVTRLELTEARALPATHGEQFIVRFQGSEAHGLEQGTYRFEQPSLGQLPIFIVPATRPGEGTHAYVAVFNRLRSDERSSQRRV